MAEDQRATKGVARWVGPALMAGSVGCFTAMVVCVKLLRESGLGTAEVMFWRSAPVIPWLAIAYRGRAQWFPRRSTAVLSRMFFGACSMATYFWAVEELTLLHNTVLQLTQPVFVALLAPFVLAERLPARAAFAAVIAIAGAMLVVVAPEDAAALALLSAVPLVPSLVRLVSSLTSACAHISIRVATTPNARGITDSPETVVLAFTWFCAVGSLAVVVVQSQMSGEVLGHARWSDAGLIAGLAVFGIVGQLCLSRAYAAAPAPIIAFVGYLAVPLSMTADWLVWGVAPHVLGLAGAALMLTAGMLLRPPRATAPPS